MHPEAKKEVLPRDTLQVLVPNPYDEWEDIYGLSFQYSILDEMATFQFEWLQSLFQERETRYGYYGRVKVSLFERLTPFILYDHFTDNKNALFKHGMNRAGAGMGIRIHDHVFVKGEYHYHWISDVDELVSGNMGMGLQPAKDMENASTQNMVRTDIIFVF